jgi:S-adenosylmethionine/arginine decarboxylase-like enzyme
METDKWTLEEYLRSAAWGLTCSVDLKGCDPTLIRNADAIKDFVVKLCELIEMKRYDETQVVNFGEDPRVSGFSMIQLIETSLISGHFANQTNAAYLDIFSCKYYHPEKVAAFCKAFFKAKSYNLNVNFRI